MVKGKNVPKAKPEAGEAKKEESQPEQARSEIKVIIVLKADRIMLGVQSPECDPVYQTSQGTLADALRRVPALVGKAKHKWDASPRNPKADLPDPPPSEVPARVSGPSGAKGKSSESKAQPLMF
ncbi:unnamed protein product [marine sediment metagenome]|uniref:Uncharacterized protein n=1 Tax=marine sediment metagenome TaxID=412755 RepID=X1TG31_9ZZZZ